MPTSRSKMHLLTLYFLDSGAYSKGIIDWFGFFRPTDYDYIHEVCIGRPYSRHMTHVPSKDQTNWFLQESSSIDQIERPFRPDTGKDFGHIWSRRSDNQLRSHIRNNLWGRQSDSNQLRPHARKLAKPNALMFFHIPLCAFQFSPAGSGTDDRIDLQTRVVFESRHTYHNP
jgi:hypothetical protein